MAIEGVLQTGVNAYAFHVHDHPVLQLSLVLSWRPEAMEGFTSNICLGKFLLRLCYVRSVWLLSRFMFMTTYWLGSRKLHSRFRYVMCMVRVMLS